MTTVSIRTLLLATLILQIFTCHSTPTKRKDQIPDQQLSREERPKIIYYLVVREKPKENTSRLTNLCTIAKQELNGSFICPFLLCPEFQTYEELCKHILHKHCQNKTRGLLQKHRKNNTCGLRGTNRRPISPFSRRLGFREYKEKCKRILQKHRKNNTCGLCRTNRRPISPFPRCPGFREYEKKCKRILQKHCKNNTCGLCGAERSKAYSLLRHIVRDHGTTKPFACFKCNKEFAHPDDKHDHERNVHKRKKFRKNHK